MIVYSSFYISGGNSNRLPLGSRGDNLSALRRASLPQETVLGCLLGNILAVTGKYTHYNNILCILIYIYYFDVLYQIL